MDTRTFDRPFDCIVLGVGGMGSAALMAAAKRGWRVLGIDRYGVAHDRGSSHGQTRIIRAAYFEHPNYVPLAQQSFEDWNDVQQFADRPLFERTGLLQAGPPDSEVVVGTLASVKQWNLDVEQMSSAQANQKFPALQIPDEHTVLFEHQAGYLRVEWCVATMCKAAKSMGAELVSGHAVDSWQVDSDGLVHVHGDTIRASAERLIVCAGPWSGKLLPEIDLDLTVLRKQLMWYLLDRVDIKSACGFPCFLVDTPEGTFYGFPQIDHLGLKVAEHTGGQVIPGPEVLQREVDPDDLRRAENFLDNYFVFGRRQRVHDSVCMYTKSADSHLIVDSYPGYPQVSIATGMSGHGFKFAPLIGERLVSLLEGVPNNQMDFLRLANRPLQAID